MIVASKTLEVPFAISISVGDMDGSMESEREIVTGEAFAEVTVTQAEADTHRGVHRWYEFDIEEVTLTGIPDCFSATLQVALQNNAKEIFEKHVQDQDPSEWVE